MGWFKNTTSVRRWGVYAANIFVGITEEITEVYVNVTANVTASVNEISSIDLKNLNPEKLKSVSLGYSTVAGSKKLKSGLAKLICGATTNLWY